MSSAIQAAQPTQPSKQWWSSKVPASKSSTMSYRPSKTPTNSSPQTTTSMGLGQKQPARLTPKPTLKFNTLASVMGFKSKKSGSPLVSPGPASPPLPFQNPPSPARAPAIRTKTFSTGSSFVSGSKSPVDHSIYTVTSSEDAFEPLTPSDQLSRHRTSYQPSLNTYVELIDHSVGMGFGDAMASQYMSSDARRISVMSDPSIIDPHLKRDFAARSSRVSASSYYPTHIKNLPAKNVSKASYVERRKSSIDSRPSRELDPSSSFSSSSSIRPKSAELRLRDQRQTDSVKPAVPKLTSSSTMHTQGGSGLRKPSVAFAASHGSNPSSRTASPARTGDSIPPRDGQRREGNDATRERKESDERAEREGGDGISSLRESLVGDSSRPPSARFAPGQGLRPKASSVSNGSTSGSSVVRSPSIATSLSSSTSLSRTMSTNGAGGSINGVRRQPSASRIRPVPPSRTPPPMVDLPPTPGSRAPSPLTFRKNRSGSASSLLNSPVSAASDEPSILALDLPPSSPSTDSASSNSVCFVQPSPNPNHRDSDRGTMSSIKNGLREIRNSPLSPGSSKRNGRDDSRPSTQPLHSKASFSSSHTLMSAFSSRGDTPSRPLKKSISQSSITASLGGIRPRVDSAASAASSTIMSDESTSLFGSVGKSLRKQRSMHNTRAPGTMLIPPLPQQLRHASSFNTSVTLNEALIADHNSHAKGESSYSAMYGPQRRAVNSVIPASTVNSPANTPTTPQTQKKRSLFYRDKGESLVQSERDRQEANNISANDLTHSSDRSDRKKAHNSQASGLGITLGLFSGHFSNGLSAQHVDPTLEPARTPPPAEDFVLTPPQSPQSPARVAPKPAAATIDQHILPPKELLSQMEALADTEAPTSPYQFSDLALEDEAGDEWSWDSASNVDKRSIRSRVESISSMSIAFGRTDEASLKSLPTSPAMSTRHFVSANGSIHSRLQGDRPSTASRLPTRTSSVFAGEPNRNIRPSTAQTFGMRSSSEHNSPFHGPPSNNSPSDLDFAPTALPPPPRRKGVAISSPTKADDEPDFTNPFSSPPVSYQPGRLQRLPSNDTISTYNPNRGSIFRKPSFLNIDDEYGEAVGSMSAVPEDSFLILERGKDSLDIRRSLDTTEDDL